MHAALKALLAVASLSVAAHAAAQATFYEHDGFAGRSINATSEIRSFGHHRFNDRASSAVIVGRPWEVCVDDDFGGSCVILPPGRHASLARFGLNDRISSARVVPPAAPIASQPPTPARSEARIIFHEREGFDGRSFSTAGQVDSLSNSGFRGRAASAVVVGERWQVCSESRLRGRCTVLEPGHYASMAAMGLVDGIASARALPQRPGATAGRDAPLPAPGELTWYEHEGFAGRSFTTRLAVANLRDAGFRERAASAVVVGSDWEVCDEAKHGGRCNVLRPGRYASLSAMGIEDRVASARAVVSYARLGDDRRIPVYDARRRDGERLHEVAITSSRAVLATSGQTCWVESQQVVEERQKANVGAAVAGAILGGILGHQVGGGSGQKVATVGGAVAGAAVGSQVGRDRGQTTTQDVERCENVPGGAQPAYWDVTYRFRGQEHRVQMAAAPGATITVNDEGEPRQ
jgi:uncharacterized protein YcfJ